MHDTHAKMIRLVDVAKQAGVSVMTVSRVLRDAPDISAATRARVRAIAEQLGYVPDVMAQGLRTQSSRLFGLILPSLVNPFYARVVQAIEERAHELGYDLLVAQSLNQVDREEKCLRRLLARRAEGIFVVPVYRLTSGAPVYEELRRRATRVVVLGPRVPFASGFVQVGADEATASSRLTQHLIGLGHRRIAYLAGPSVAPSAQERFEGYRRALREAEIDLDDRLVFHAGSTIEEGRQAALQVVNEGVRFSAVQAVNDLVAIGAAEILLGQGVRIPQECSVVGFGNIPLAEYFRVPLTTVRQPKYRLGAAAVEAMLMLRRGETPTGVRLPAEVILRSSTAPPDLQTRLWQDPPERPAATA